MNAHEHTSWKRVGEEDMSAIVVVGVLVIGFAAVVAIAAIVDSIRQK